ncbi:MAG: glycerate kinase [Thermofilaceae archaeon]|nr:glycerate kinase [Thermofilaceae archaeon]MCX8180678.1 glycerate kinase [Thermofilaceae archaeon]MDW8003782.1 glycerate kinase [Thermofilaceae archaeon]
MTVEELTEYSRKIALTLLLEGLRAADPRNLLRNKLFVRGTKLEVNGEEFDLSRGVYVVALGKAAPYMAEELENILGTTIKGGVATIPRGGFTPSFKIFKAVEAGHPYPDGGSLKAGKLALELAERAKQEGCPLIVLISGGGSSLAEVPVHGISLDEIQSVTTLLLKSGATINEINTIRKHISLLKGGRLAATAYPAPVIALVLSDVIDDRLDTIASGPTVPDPTTYSDALEVLERYNLLDKVPNALVQFLTRGLKGEEPETPKQGDVRLSNTFTTLLGNNLVALKVMESYARELGLNATILTSRLQGEAREVAKVLASIALEVRLNSLPLKPPAALICGGETTVTVRGKGRGGRNQEFALSAALMIEGTDGVSIAAMGSDGIDGITDVAGAVVDGSTITKARKAGLDPLRFLNENNSYEFFKAVGGHIRTGPTGTNVNDFYIAVVVTEDVLI